MRSLVIGVLTWLLFLWIGSHPVPAADCLLCPTAVEDSLVELINQFRVGQGLAPFEIDARLIASARRQAGDMIRNDFLSFEGTDGSTPSQRQLDAMYPSPGVENLVVQSESAQATFDLLAGAGAATANWLNPSYFHIGVGHFTDQSGEATSAWALDYGGTDGAVEETVCRVIFCPDPVESQLLDLINQTRVDNGLPGLTEDARLVTAAQTQACAMGLYYFVSDSSITGQPPSERILTAGYDQPGPTLIASGLMTLQQVVDGWLTDPDSRQQLLSPTVTQVGVGFGGNGLGPVPYAWTVDCGVATNPALPPDCGCCIDERGNVNADPNEDVNLTDLTVLVNHLFVTFEPIFCDEEANLSEDPEEALTLTDLTILVNHLFVTFQPLPNCP